MIRYIISIYNTYNLCTPKILNISQINLWLAKENKWFETRDRGTTARRRWVGPKLRALRWNLCDIWIHLTGGRRGVSAHLYLGGLQLTFVSFLSISALYLPNVDNLSEDPWSPDWYTYGWPPHMPGCCCNRLEWAASGNWAGLCSQPDWYTEMFHDRDLSEVSR